jgi:membrane protein
LFSTNLDPVHPWWSRWRPTVRYMMEIEAHVYALAISASVLLSFYPFVIVMVTLCRKVLHWPAAVDAIYLALDDYFPRGLGDFIRRNTPIEGLPGTATPLLLLLIAANGVFEPLEVAFNRAWGVTRNRPYWKNQLVALGMILVCGCLALASLMLTALNARWVPGWLSAHGAVEGWMRVLFFKMAALPLSILALFLIYWLLPNRKVDPARVAPAAIAVGLALEVLKYLNLLIWPFFSKKLENEYNIFQHSVTILLWSFAASLIVLAGAEWIARRDRVEPL